MVLGMLLALAQLPAQASTLRTGPGIEVIHTTASYVFGEEMAFSLLATSDTAITECYLFFRAKNEDFTHTVALEFTSSPDLDVTHTHDLRTSPFSPFASVTYWWQVRDEAGHVLATDPQNLEYIDDRFEWKALSDNGITVHWTGDQADPRFGQTALDIAIATLPRINVELQAPIPEDIHIYVYANQEQLQSAALLADRKWITGQAHPEMDVIVIAVTSQIGYGPQMMRDIPHEITHLLIYRKVSPEAYYYVPEWLDEGLAAANEALPNSVRATALAKAQASGNLIPLSDLCVPFPPDPQTTTLAYAQSASIVKFIRDRYGADGIRALLEAYAEGASCSTGVVQSLGPSLSGLEMTWEASIAPSAEWRIWLNRGGFFIGLLGLGLLLSIPMIGFRRSGS